MKNNKGFAITATIYGFLILFLIILLSVLSVMRSQNNRSITISEKIENKLFPSVEVTTDSPETITEYSITKRGKYYIRLIKTSGNPVDNCTIYLPNSGTLKVESNTLKLNGNNITIYNSSGTAINNSGIESFVITKYYSSSGIITVDFDLNYDINNMKNWQYVYGDRFNVEYYNKDYNNSIYLYGKANFEHIYMPISIEKNNDYIISFDYSIKKSYQPLSDYDPRIKGIGCQIILTTPRNNDNIEGSLSTEYLPTEETKKIEHKTISFNSKNNEKIYLNFNFGMASDNQDILVNIGNFKITTANLGTRKVSFNQEYNDLPTPTRNGKQFKEWNTKKDGSGVKVDKNTKVEIPQNHTLYAIWK